MKKFLAVIALASVFLVGCNVNNSVDDSDFSFDASWATEKFDNSLEISTNEFSGAYYSWVTIKIISNRNDIYYKVYDNSAGTVIDQVNYGPPEQRKAGPYELSKEVTLKTIYEGKTIEVCGFLDQNFKKGDKGAVCKVNLLPERDIGIELTPNELTFELNNQKKSEEKRIAVKNIGDFTVPIIIGVPGTGSFFSKDYPPYYPQYNTNPGCGSRGLKPMQTIYCDIVVTPSVNGVDSPVLDASKGQHTDTGLVKVLVPFDESNRNYDLRFTLETLVD
ncbi:MAG TPA: hypothetical protein VJH23_06740 [archaeon]|nr:hypothetical protein [archaeon]